jgi:peptidoglycan/LPS O-acetylase OafA/YrhL
MTVMPAAKTTTRTPRTIAVAFALVAATLAAMSALHLGGVLEGSPPFQPHSAAIAEAVIGAVLAAGAAVLLRRSSQVPAAALAANAFAVIGFTIGLTFTLRGGGAVDISYHATVLPLLLVTLSVLWSARRRGLSANRAERGERLSLPSVDRNRRSA